MPPGPPPSLLRLLTTTLMIGATSFGGGLNAFVRQVFVVRRAWVEDATFLEALEVAQVLPGPNVVNLVVALGARLRGGPGGAVALAGLIAPAIAANCLLAAVVLRVAHDPVVGGALVGFAAAAIGITVANVAELGKAHLTGVLQILLAVAAAVAVGALGLELLLAIVVFGVPGVLLAHHRAQTG